MEKNKKPVGGYYGSPRWTGELLDCSMPMTFDTYNKCSYNCLYCFSYFQKSHTLGKKTNEKKQYQKDVDLQWVNTDRIKSLFSGKETGALSQFNDYIHDKKVMQWGGLSDQFDNYERANGITLELLKYFKSINYPLCFSTKSNWFVFDERYASLIAGQSNWNCKFSIINLDDARAAKMERGVATPHQRLEALKEYNRINPEGNATLRLRPFIIGHSDRNNEHLELIKLAKEYGSKAVTTEFFCLERRADDRLKERYHQMSEIVGFDIIDFYSKNSKGAGYCRLNYNIKRKYVDEMQSLCEKLGMRFYVSDAHHKEKCCNGSCCGLGANWNYSRGQFTEALMIAKEKGQVKFSDIEPHLEMFKKMKYIDLVGFNTNSSENRAQRKNMTAFDYIREIWNTPNNDKSPYKYFNGILVPVALDNEKKRYL